MIGEKYEVFDVLGWSTFGTCKIRLWVDEKNHYTMRMFLLTSKFSFGYHIGGSKKVMK